MEALEATEDMPASVLYDVTDTHKELIQKLRERVGTDLPSEKDNDHFLKKWLIARNYDLDRAEEMLKKHLSFWKVNGLDKLQDGYVPIEATDYFHTAHLGYDNDGSVVRMLHLGACDLKGLVMSIPKMESVRCAINVVQNDVRKQLVDRADKPMCDKQVYIFDMQGLNWMSVINRAVAERAFMLLRCYEANYPEYLKIVYLINAPSFFSFIYNWLKTVLPASILSKIHVVTQENCKEIITQNIDPSILPASVGGTRVDENGDCNCPSLYKMPLNVPVPESFLLSNQLSVLDGDPKAVRHVVNSGSSLTLKVDVKEPNTALEWDFQTSFYDISFSLNYRENESAPAKVIIPFHRVDSHQFPESGNFVCPDAGIYEIVFDNSYSWMTRKELIYKIAMKPPGEPQ